MHVGHSVVHRNQLTMQFPFHRIHIPVDLGRTNLPVVHNSFVNEHQKREIGLQIHFSLAYSRLSKLDIFGDLNTIRYLQGLDISRKQIEIEHEFEHHYSHFCGTCVIASANQNSSVPQKELLLWYWNLELIMHCIQFLWVCVHFKRQIATELLFKLSSIPNFLPQEIVQYQRVSLACWKDLRSAWSILKRSIL